MTSRLRVLGYARADTEAELAVQRRAIEGECVQRGWDMHGIACDTTPSGGLGFPELPRVLAGLDVGQADVLVCTGVSRLSRSLTDFIELLDRARRHRWRVVVLDIGFDLADPSGMFLAELLVRCAQRPDTA